MLSFSQILVKLTDIVTEHLPHIWQIYIHILQCKLKFCIEALNLCTKLQIDIAFMYNNLWQNSIPILKHEMIFLFLFLLGHGLIVIAQKALRKNK